MIETQSIEQVEEKRRPAGRRMRFLIGGIVIAAALGYLIYSAASGSAAYYVTIEELDQSTPMRRNVRVSGNVVGDSIVWEARDLRLQFDLRDESGQLAVVYNGARPDMFRDGAEVVVEGKMGEGGVFEARTMLLKCPSKYEEAE
jgi:cytochrome c-type biogenesis protein CcmE